MQILNGQQGKVLAPGQGTTRDMPGTVKVKLQSGTEVAVKPENLEKCEAEPEIPAGQVAWGKAGAKAAPPAEGAAPAGQEAPIPGGQVGWAKAAAKAKSGAPGGGNFGGWSKAGPGEPPAAFGKSMATAAPAQQPVVWAKGGMPLMAGPVPAGPMVPGLASASMATDIIAASTPKAFSKGGGMPGPGEGSGTADDSNETKSATDPAPAFAKSGFAKSSAFSKAPPSEDRKPDGDSAESKDNGKGTEVIEV